MGCSSSKYSEGRQVVRERWSSPLPRSISMPVFHRPARQGDSYHVVALTSCSYGVLKVDCPGRNGVTFVGVRRDEKDATNDSDDFFSWTRLDAQQIIANMKLTSVKEVNEGCNVHREGETEIINTWELMAGIEDGSSPSPLKRVPSPLKLSESGTRRTFARSVSFHTVQEVDAHFTRMRSALASASSNNYELAKENTEPQIEFSLHKPVSRKTFNSISLSPNGSTPSMRKSHGNLSFDGGNARLSISTDGTLQGSGQMSPLDGRNSALKPVWMSSSDSVRESNSPSFDPAIMATFEKALESVSEGDWCYSSGSMESYSSQHAFTTTERSLAAETSQLERFGGIWNTRENNLFESGIEGRFDRSSGTKFCSKVSPVDYEEKESERGVFLENFELKCPPGGEEKVVLYSTSLRGVRKTYEDCCDLKLIFQVMRVHVDERDVWLHSKFKQELSDLLGKAATVPRVFVKGRYAGDAEEVKRLHEEGILSRLLEGLPIEVSRKACEGCGDVRFIPCLTCSGSCKLISNDNVVKKCPDCNENGLIMCPICS